jgi:hypothetical protein
MPLDEQGPSPPGRRRCPRRTPRKPARGITRYPRGRRREFGASTGFRELERNGGPNGEEVRRWNPELAGPGPDRAPSAAFMLIPKVLHAFLADGMAKGRAALIRPSATPSTARQVPELLRSASCCGWRAGSVRAVTRGAALLFARRSATARGPGRGGPGSSGPLPLAGLVPELRCQTLTVPRCLGRALCCQTLTVPHCRGGARTALSKFDTPFAVRRPGAAHAEVLSSMFLAW